MTTEPIGVYDCIVAKRDIAVRGMTQLAKSQAFPRLYATPAPRSRDDLMSEVMDLREANKKLAEDTKKLRNQIAIMKTMIPSRHGPVESALRMFIAVLADVGYQIEGRAYTLEDLKSQRRSRRFAWPRHVVAAICRAHCQSASLPAIAHAMGGRDHTSIMHACTNAPRILKMDTQLAEADRIVRARLFLMAAEAMQ